MCKIYRVLPCCCILSPILYHRLTQWGLVTHACVNEQCYQWTRKWLAPVQILLDNHTCLIFNLTQRNNFNVIRKIMNHMCNISSNEIYLETAVYKVHHLVGTILHQSAIQRLNEDRWVMAFPCREILEVLHSFRDLRCHPTLWRISLR